MPRDSNYRNRSAHLETIETKHELIFKHRDPISSEPWSSIKCQEHQFQNGQPLPTVLHGIGEGGLDKPSYLNDDNYDKDDGDKYIDNDDNADMVRKSKLPAPAVRQKPAQDETSRQLQNPPIS